MIKKLYSVFSTAILILLFFSCQKTETQTQESFNWDGLANSYIDDYFARYPLFAVQSGKHEYDGQMTDFSEEGIREAIDMFSQYKDTLQSIDTARLDADQKFEREYMMSEVDENLFWLSSANWFNKNPAAYFDALSPDPYIIFDYAPLAVRIKSLTMHLEKIPVAVEQIKANLSGNSMPSTYAYLGNQYFDGLASYIETDVPKIFEPVKDDSLQANLRQAIGKASSVLKEMAGWIQERPADSSYAMGAALYKEMLYATERVVTPLDELKKRGEDDLERNLAALKGACDQFAPGKSLSACVIVAKAHKPAGGPVKVATQQLVGLKQFIIDHDIVTIPGDEQCKVDQAPPYKASNAAYIQIPGPFEKGLSSTYYIAPPDPNWTPEEQSKYIPDVGDLKYISVHEVWPGHFLQFLHSNRSGSLFGRLFVGYAFAEGWAHYTEEMMYDQGLDAGNPEMHIGQLTNALLRDVRYLSSIGLHTEGMTVQESEKMFVEKAFQDIGNARQQAARGTYDPGYLNYTLGKLLIKEVRKEWMDKTGKSLKEFHDTFLSYGGPPIALIRSRMR
jgi:Bacterial protein of unknown function (DUF885)